MDAPRTDQSAAATHSPQPTRSWSITANRLSCRLCRHWFGVFLLGYGLFAGLPFLAPLFMHWGWTGPAKAIYTLFSVLCHQLAERSFFLFGPKGMYSLGEFQAAHVNPSDFLALRQFIGSPALGWKVAWSDRMVAMFSGIWLAAGLWWPLRKRLAAFPAWLLGLLVLPLALDGTSHLVSDFAGLGLGFRDSNQWLAALTGNAFPPGFYAGDALGSFNSLMRVGSGLLFAVGVVFFAFPYVQGYFEAMARFLEARFERAGRHL